MVLCDPLDQTIQLVLFVQLVQIDPFARLHLLVQMAQ